MAASNTRPSLDGWFVYILRSRPFGVYYTGITVDLLRRLQQHNDNTGAKFTRGKGPWEVLGTRKYKTRSEALKEECRVKAMTRKQKETWVHGTDLSDSGY